MKEIPLTQGKIAIVDDEDYQGLSQYKWCAAKLHGIFYAVRAVRGENKKHILMHREILGLTKGDGKQTDHHNHNSLDNRKCNIRICSNRQNQQNRHKKRGCSQYKGVSWYKRDKKWFAQIKVNSQKIHLGCFNNQIDAAKAYDKKAKELFGEFACTNF